MRNEIYFLFLTSCVFHICLANSIDDHTEIINELKLIVGSTVDELSKYQNNFQTDVKNYLQIVHTDNLRKINNDLNYVSNSIMNAVTAVGSTGKNAQSCYEACKVSLKNLNKQTNNKLDECYHSFSFYTEPALKIIKTAIQNGKNISEDLDTIFIGCTKHLTESGDCLKEKIEEVRRTLRKMQADVENIKNTGTSAMKKAKTVVTSCSDKAVRSLHVEATFNIQREANNCTTNLEGSSVVEKLTFYNHTECECRERTEIGVKVEKTAETRFARHHPPIIPQNLRKLPPKKPCRCPSEFLPKITPDAECQCKCSDTDQNCIRTRRGKVYFSIRDRLCIHNGDCTQPICEFGEYMSRQGKCPRKQEQYSFYSKYHTNVHHGLRS